MTAGIGRRTLRVRWEWGIVTARGARGLRDFRDLEAWQTAMRLAEEIYHVTREFPPEERFGLTSQMRRAAVSIASNIAEGNARGATQDYIRFLRMARGSAAELDTQLELASRLGYLTPSGDLTGLIGRCRQLLQGLLRSLEARQNP